MPSMRQLEDAGGIFRLLKGNCCGFSAQNTQATTYLKQLSYTQTHTHKHTFAGFII